MLTIDRVSRSFGGVAALDVLDLTVADGEVVGLIGPNGSGKTTLFNVITGVHAADSGRVLLRGEDITHNTPARIVRRGIARTFQNLRIFQRMSVCDNVWVAQHSLPGVGPMDFCRTVPRLNGRAGRRSTTCSTPLASRIGGTFWRAACRSPISGGSNWHGRSPARRRCCCWTSRPGA